MRVLNAAVVKGLRRFPFTEESRVRFPSVVPKNKHMTEQLKELIKNDEIKELEIIELIETYQKLVNLNILSDSDFCNLLEDLGVENPKPNKFILDDECSFELL